ncbi:hypothetical protein DTO169E5_1695 [Paecilomyces variotii]|nr:hypothetical protein DTO169E5_1695 [Paecilomyces variotii]
MAANDYYNSFNHTDSSGHVPPSTHSFSRPTPPPVYTGPTDIPSPYENHNEHPINHHSQVSLASENDYYAQGGRPPTHDQYADDIPLKANAQPAIVNEADWTHQNTQYPPSPEGLNTPPHRRRRGALPGKRGFFKKKIAWVTWLLTAIDIGVFIGELVKSAQLTGSPIETKPTFNPMIGPSSYVQINMGARFIPCMKNVPGVQNNNQTINWSCPNSTTTDANDPSNQCTLSTLCGFNGVPNPHPGGSLDDRPEPDQWFRFIIPMFLHGGFIHIGFNMLVQISMGADMERMIGWWRYTLVYLASGIFGFVLGGNYAAQGIASTGASGSLFGILALFLLDLFYTWKERQSPWVEFILMLVGVGISFVLGLLPGLDNFSHIGGFIMGLALGLCLLRSPNWVRERIGLARTPYVAMSGGAGPGTAEPDDKAKKFTKQPLDYFQGRKPFWWIWWLIRVGALVAVIVGFIVLVTNFYKYPKSNCSWCYRLSCLPVKNWCTEGNLQLTSSSN